MMPEEAEGSTDSLKLELQLLVTAVRVLGTNLRASALNYHDIFPACKGDPLWK